MDDTIWVKYINVSQICLLLTIWRGKKCFLSSLFCLSFHLIQSTILAPFKQLHKTENARYGSFMNQLCNQHQSTLRQWRASKRFLTGERGAWCERYGPRVSLYNAIILNQSFLLALLTITTPWMTASYGCVKK